MLVFRALFHLVTLKVAIFPRPHLFTLMTHARQGLASSLGQLKCYSCRLILLLLPLQVLQLKMHYPQALLKHKMFKLILL